MTEPDMRAWDRRIARGQGWAAALFGASVAHLWLAPAPWGGLGLLGAVVGSATFIALNYGYLLPLDGR